jgi:hypothetical protein
LQGLFTECLTGRRNKGVALSQLVVVPAKSEVMWSVVLCRNDPLVTTLPSIDLDRRFALAQNERSAPKVNTWKF